jgi:hypothetical protein
VNIFRAGARGSRERGKGTLPKIEFSHCISNTESIRYGLWAVLGRAASPPGDLVREVRAFPFYGLKNDHGFARMNTDNTNSYSF